MDADKEKELDTELQDVADDQEDQRMEDVMDEQREQRLDRGERA